MALALRLRRAIAASATALHPFAAATSGPAALSRPARPSATWVPRAGTAAGFHSTAPSLGRTDRWGGDGEDNKISPDEILFEGCDYNHWLITMEFPKDPKPSPEEMVEAYVQTAAKVFGSVEEAKQKIYACSTTTYQGFQVLCSEEVSEKFRGLPGVVFILPDSYLYPETKEYGGDKYENGIITPRPPPVQYHVRPKRPNNYDDRPMRRGDYQGNQRGYQGNYQGNDRPYQGQYQGNPNPQQQGNFAPNPPRFQGPPPQGNGPYQGQFQGPPPPPPPQFQQGNFPPPQGNFQGNTPLPPPPQGRWQPPRGQFQPGPPLQHGNGFGGSSANQWGNPGDYRNQQGYDQGEDGHADRQQGYAHPGRG